MHLMLVSDGLAAVPPGEEKVDAAGLDAIRYPQKGSGATMSGGLLDGDAKAQWVKRVLGVTLPTRTAATLARGAPDWRAARTTGRRQARQWISRSRACRQCCGRAMTTASRRSRSSG